MKGKNQKLKLKNEGFEDDVLFDELTDQADQVVPAPAEPVEMDHGNSRPSPLNRPPAREKTFRPERGVEPKVRRSFPGRYGRNHSSALLRFGCRRSDRRRAPAAVETRRMAAAGVSEGLVHM